jgi:hypothetical protein
MIRENKPLELSTIEILKMNRLYVSGGTPHCFQSPLEAGSTGRIQRPPVICFSAKCFRANGKSHIKAIARLDPLILLTMLQYLSNTGSCRKRQRHTAVELRAIPVHLG